MSAPAPIDDLLDATGSTPLVALHRLHPSPHTRLAVKLESFSPNGTWGDRTARWLWAKARQEGRLEKGTTVIDLGVGDASFGLALRCRQEGLAFVAVLPESASWERQALLAAYGAKLERVNGQGGRDALVARARQIAGTVGRSYCIDALDAEALVALHRADAVGELMEQLRGEPLRRVVFPEPMAGVAEASAPTFTTTVVRPPAEGWRGVGAVDALPGAGSAQRTVVVSNADAWAMRGRLAREEGILVGPAGAAAVKAALDGRGEETGWVVAWIPDTGERSFSVAEQAP